jgi:hypothetical protein
MRTTIRHGLSVVIAASSVGVLGMGLGACLDDYTVLPPDAGASPGVDSAPPPAQEAGPIAPEAGTDATPGTDAEAGGPKTHCDTVMPPAMANQFLCADFDSLLLSKGWDDVMRNNGGTAEKTMDVAFSAPFALAANASGSNSAGVLTWKRSAPTAFLDAMAVFRLNPGMLGGVAPASQGVIELLTISTTNASVTFGYSRGSTVFDTTGAAYTGYFVNVATFGSGAAAVQRNKVNNVPANVWTEVKLTWESSGKTNLFYDNANVLGIAGTGSNDTQVSFRLGAVGNGGVVGAMPVHRFDDVELSIHRQ